MLGWILEDAGVEKAIVMGLALKGLKSVVWLWWVHYLRYFRSVGANESDASSVGEGMVGLVKVELWWDVNELYGFNFLLKVQTSKLPQISTAEIVPITWNFFNFRIQDLNWRSSIKVPQMNSWLVLLHRGQR